MAAIISASLIYAKVYPVPAVVTVAAEIAPEPIVTEATPLEPSPRIGIPVIVVPEDVLKPVCGHLKKIQIKIMIIKNLLILDQVVVAQDLPMR